MKALKQQKDDRKEEGTQTSSDKCNNNSACIISLYQRAKHSKSVTGTGTLFVHVEKKRNEKDEKAPESEDIDKVKVYTAANETVETRYD